MLYLCSYGWASSGMCGILVWLFGSNSVVPILTAMFVPVCGQYLGGCVCHGVAACLAECRRVSHHVCGVWVWLWVSELVGSCESLGVGCVVCPCVLGSVSSHAVCEGVPWCLGVAEGSVYSTVQTVVCDIVCQSVFAHMDARLFLTLPQDTPQPLLSLRRGAGEPPLCPGASPTPPCPAQPLPPPRGHRPHCASKQEPQSN